jgi:hypothetical protein
MLRKGLAEKTSRRSSYPQSLKALRKSYTAALLSPAATLSQSVATESASATSASAADREHTRSVEAFQLLLDSQRQEIAEKDAALESFKNTSRDITISTIPVERLMGLPTHNMVEKWLLQFTTNKNLKPMESISPESRAAIDLEANSRGLSVEESWISFPDADILVMIKACFPQKSEGEELSSNQYVEKIKQQVHLLFPGEKGSLQFIHRCINFCNLLSTEKADNIPLQRDWIFSIWNKVPKNMKIRKLNKLVMDLTTLKSFFYLISKYHFDIAQQNLPVEDNGFIVTPNPIYGFHYLSGKRKDVDPSDKPPKIQKTDLSLEESCGFCGRNTAIKLNGKSYPHTKKLCFCKLHVDKNVSDLPWSKSPMGISYKSLGLNFLPNNKKLSGDKKSMVDYSMPKEESSGNH